MALHVQMEIPARREVIEAALEGLTAANVELMRGRRFPHLYDAPVLFRPEPEGQEDWQTADRLLASGEGDCEDHAGYHAAWLRVYGGEPTACVAVVPIGATGNFHAMVRRANGSIEDPSLVIINREAKTMSQKPQVQIQAIGGYCLGQVDVPLAGGHTLRARGVGFDPMQALQQAVSTVVEASNHPEVYAMLPPQASLALLAIHGISKMSDDGLRKLKDDPRATQAEIKLAQQALKARREAMRDAKAEPSPTDIEEIRRWATWGDSVGAAAPAYFGGGTVVRTHPAGQGQAVPGRGTTAPGTIVPRPGAGPNVAPGGIVPPSSTTSLPPAATPPGTTVTPGTLPPGGVYQSGTSVPLPGELDPTGQFFWTPGISADQPGHWTRASTAPQPGSGPAAPPYGTPYGTPPGGGYTAPGFFPGYGPPGAYGGPPMMPPGYGPPYGPPMPGYPGQPGYQGYDPMAAYYAQYYGGFYGSPSQVVPWDPSQIMPEPLSADEAAAITLWGSGAFAEGAFPGYQQG